LQEELERYRAASSKVEELEKDNKRLAEELEQALNHRNYALAITKRDGMGTTPTGQIDEPSSSLADMGLKASNVVSKEKHQSLIAKYNLVCEVNQQIREAKSVLEARQERDKQKLREWNVFKVTQEAMISRKDEKIQRLKEDAKRLKARLGEISSDQDSYSGTERAQTSQYNPINILIQAHETSPRKVRIGNRRIEKIEEADLPDLSDGLHLAISDTQFQDIEQHGSSSTEDSDPVSELNSNRVEYAIKTEPLSQNNAVVTSSRTLRKRRMPNQSTEPNNVKLEHDLGTSPLELANVQDGHDSIDLDDIGEKVNTPRKRKHDSQVCRKTYDLASSPLSPRHGRHDVQSVAINDDKSTRSTPITNGGSNISVLQPRSVNSAITPRTSVNRATKKRKITTDEAVNSLIEDGELICTKVLAAKITSNGTERLSALLANPSPQKQALTPVRLNTSVNQIQLAKRQTPSRLAHEMKRKGDANMESIAPCKSSSKLKNQPQVQEASNAVSNLTDYTLKHTQPSSRNAPRTTVKSMSPSSKNSLGNSPRSSGRGSVYSTNETKASARLTEFFKSVQANMTPTREAMEDDSLSRSSTKAPLNGSAKLLGSSSRCSAQSSSTKDRRSRTTIEATDGTGVNPSEKPLRSRPVQSLTLLDFKINPNYNQGFNFAFSEVVRGQDARKCLQGCTKPGCCGSKFRALVRGLRDPTKPLTASQEEADSILLDEYLGDNAYKLQNMSKEERDEVLLQARTRDYANKNGKHRHAFERPSSPPGFWRADMPTTQEEIEDRERAREEDRNIVEERYQEAMRKGGRFIFRDE
jgi:hypothetical protein